MIKGYLLRHFASLLTFSLCSRIVLFSSAAYAGVPLQHAVIASLKNAVELSLFNQTPRSAKIRDTLNPGDALSTARTARAELRFNDGSLARVGGQALFRFVSETRTLQLSSGTLLVLVPPNRGQTYIQTPNTTADIHGSALFVRYLPNTDVTLIGALTEGGIKITNRDRSQTQTLQAGQIAVVASNRIEQVYRFDLTTFYSTSDLVKGLNLQCAAAGERSEVNPAIAAVRAETAEAAKTQALRGICNEATAAEGQPPVTNAIVSGGDQPAPLSTTQVVQPPENPSSIAPPTSRLLAPPTVSLPATFPPTVALPTTPPLLNPPSASQPAPPRLVEHPDVTGTSPGLAGTPQGGLPSGQTGALPGQVP